MEDLIAGVLPAYANELSADEAWDVSYQHMEEFVDVVFSQIKDRLRDHRKQVGANLTRADVESAALARERLLIPRHGQKHHRGEPVFDLHPAKLLLRGDVKEGIYRGMTPTQLQKTRSIYQEVPPQKLINHLNQRRSQGFF
jgi:hypothetical protein